jgi:CTP:molybdopterin cytidylyltransferase MocA
VPEALAVVNDAPERGLSSSLRLGLRAAADTESDRAVVLLADLPGVTPEAVRAVAAAPDPVALAGYRDGRGHPVALDRSVWAEVGATTHGDARAFVASHPEQVVDRLDDADVSPTDAGRPRGLAAVGRKDG